jgi:hypothetical protein
VNWLVAVEAIEEEPERPRNLRDRRHVPTNVGAPYWR